MPRGNYVAVIRGLSHMKALIFGITGQDGSYLSELLLSKGYEVHGVVRRSSSITRTRIDHLRDKLHLHYGDVTDATAVLRVLGDTRPDEVYNLAAQSHVGVSFEVPEYTANADAVGALRILEAIRLLKLPCRFYQASTSELYGNQPAPQSEATPFKPCSPYACAKLYAHAITVNYREAYGIHASCGIMFNHESPRRGETFVTRKITKGVAAVAKGSKEPIRLGNLDAKRDWGHARDYVEGMWLMLQQKSPDDYIFATGESRSVEDFATAAFEVAGVWFEWATKVSCEPNVRVGINKRCDEYVIGDAAYQRPLDVQHLCGDATKAREILGWSPKTSFSELVREMVQYDLGETG